MSATSLVRSAAGGYSAMVDGQAVPVRWNVVDRAIASVAPAWGASRLQARVGHALFSAYGGGYNGASFARRSLAGWNPLGGDADSQILTDLRELRERSRDLRRNSPLAGGAIGTSVTNVVGTGLAVLPRVNARVLRLSPAEAAAWQENVAGDFELWAASVHSDLTRVQNFYLQQGLLFGSVLEAGDHCVILARNEKSPLPVKLALQHVEADRLCNMGRAPDRPGLVAGVEVDSDGAALRYHFASANPERRIGARLEWTSVEAWGPRSGRQNVIHAFERTRAGQTRGVPMLAAVIEPLKQLERYTEAELMAAVVSGLFTVFISAGGPASVMPSAVAGSAGGAASGSSTASGSGWDAKLGNGLVVELAKGDSVSTANPGRPNAAFEPFVTAITRQIGLQLQIPFEVLTKHYTASYSAARAAMLDAWRFWKVRRQWLVFEFCQPVYAAWLDEAVAIGLIRAPGYFADPAIRAAWTRAVWTGDGPGSIDPLKDVQAAGARVRLSISTLEQESLQHDGVEWDQKVTQRARERQLLAEQGLRDPTDEGRNPPAAPPSAPSRPRPGHDGAPSDLVKGRWQR
ncbi:MAG: phage portal protein [Rubrivivax sp.]|nr:phage portal protein [Rubrivivax sp.]